LKASGDVTTKQIKLLKASGDVTPKQIKLYPMPVGVCNPDRSV